MKRDSKITSAGDRVLTVMAVILFIAVIALVVVIVWPFEKNEIAVGTVEFFLICLLALILLLRQGRLATLKLGKEGIEATMAEAREATQEARETTKEVKDFMKTTAAAVLGLVKRTGRGGGYSYDDKEQIRKDILANLREMGMSQEEIEDIEKESRWHEYVAVDYVYHILQGRFWSPKQEPSPEAARGEAKLMLRRLTTTDLPTPDELEELMKRHNVLTKETGELIEDYRHYVKHHEQRRPEVWAKRGEWSNVVEVRP